MNPTHIIRATIRYRQAGRYSVTVEGKTIVANSRHPELAACKALMKDGRRGRVEFRVKDTGRALLTVKSPSAGVDLMAWEDGERCFVAGSTISRAREANG